MQIHKEGCTLEWSPPDDDGGEPLDEYIIEAQDANDRGKFVEVGRCGPGQTSFKVKGLKTKGEYKFRLVGQLINRSQIKSNFFLTQSQSQN